MPEEVRDITLRVRTTRDEGPTRSTERVDELGDHVFSEDGVAFVRLDVERASCETGVLEPVFLWRQHGDGGGGLFERDAVGAG